MKETQKGIHFLMFAGKNNYSGVFITLEGVDGSGKSFVLPLLAKRLKEDFNKEVLITREPGGTEISESVRELLFKYHDSMDTTTELLLFLASRSAHVSKILKALNEGKIVIADRYADSTYVYQGLLQNMDLREVFDLNSFATKNLNPDITFSLIVSYEESQKRLSGRKDNGKYDSASKEEFLKIANGYQTLQRMFPNRLFLINAAKTPEEILEEMMVIISKHKVQKMLES